MRRAPIHIARVIDSESGELDVIATWDIAYGYYEVAAELWRLAGDEDRSVAIEDIFLSAYDFTPPRLDAARMVALRAQLDGIEDALARGVTDAEHVLSMQKVQELRPVARELDLDEARGELARYAVQEALVYVDRIRQMIDFALKNDAQLVLD